MQKLISKITDIIIGTAAVAGSFILIVVMTALPYALAILVVLWVLSMF